ncbi:indole-3-glycerol-phosphate synthase [freshwater metagenome]|uniref:indole-3-glycerol-phosphate synthase n=1 Tax=freshwater metagenome TaxID=449393 RepID=A0A094QEB2_9ZZZZ
MLQSLYAGAIADAKTRQESVSLSEIELLASKAKPALDAIAHLGSGEFVKVIAEIKRASPSKGYLATIADPGALASVYESAGAAAISVLTEQRSFLGSLQDFDEVRAAVSLPLLRKDFIANEYQVFEARAHGADIVLLIAAGLDPADLVRLKALIESLGMTAFIETHNRSEVEFAASIGAKLVGVNARDLTTFETDRNLFEQLIDILPGDCIKVAESAVRGVADVEAYAAAGADCVLVGEALVTGDAEDLVSAFSRIAKA